MANETSNIVAMQGVQESLTAMSGALDIVSGPGSSLPRNIVLGPVGPILDYSSAAFAYADNKLEVAFQETIDGALGAASAAVGRIIGGLLGGAAVGAVHGTRGGPWGAVAGGAVGGVLGAVYGPDKVKEFFDKRKGRKGDASLFLSIIFPQ